MPKVPISEAANADLNGASAGFSNASRFWHQREEARKHDCGADDARSGFVICSGGLYPNTFRVQTVDFENAEPAKSDDFTTAWQAQRR